MKWTEAELEYLCENYSKCDRGGIKELCKTLKKSYSSVSKKAFALGLSKMQNGKSHKRVRPYPNSMDYCKCGKSKRQISKVCQECYHKDRIEHTKSLCTCKCGNEKSRTSKLCRKCSNEQQRERFGTVDRNAEIAEKFKKGVKCKELTAEYKISRQRLYQILGEFGLSSKDAGRKCEICGVEIRAGKYCKDHKPSSKFYRDDKCECGNTKAKKSKTCQKCSDKKRQGEAANCVKLTEEDVRKIRGLYYHERLTGKEIWKLFPGISLHNIYKILSYSTWRHVK